MAPTTLEIHPSPPLRGEAKVPGDKSITHRGLILAALGDGPCLIEGALDSGDCLKTAQCLSALGVSIEHVGPGQFQVQGVGLGGLKEPGDVLDCGRSGTTFRLLAGLLAGQRFFSVLSGDPQLLGRPMARVTTPLRAMGADIRGRQGGAFGPLAIEGRPLQGMALAPPIPSAQVKSAILLAGLYATGETTVTEAGPSRDHTERMMPAWGVTLDVEGPQIRLTPPSSLTGPRQLRIPGDGSSAAFLIVAALLTPESDITLKGVGINPTRRGLISALKAMGGRIDCLEESMEGGEPTGTLRIRHSQLQGVAIGGRDIVTMIDEIPLLALAATQAEGRTRIGDARELRAKESDRLAGTSEVLNALGASVVELEDGLEIQGPTPLNGTSLNCHRDHRLAMMGAIAGLIAKGSTQIKEANYIHDSFPTFTDTLTQLGAILHPGEAGN